MKLRIENIYIKDVCFGTETTIAKGVLTINKSEMIEAIQASDFSSIDIELAKPGEHTRIIPVKDVVEPRIKLETQSCFPGILDAYEFCGEGVTKVLKGCCVTTAGSIVGFQEGFIDMCGLGAQYTHYSKLINIILVVEPFEGIGPVQYEEQLRLLALRAARFLGKAALNIEPDEIINYEKKAPSENKKLPKIAYAYLIMAQGLLHDNYVYGIDAKGLPAITMHPNELFDGAIISGNCVSASDKNTTYDNQNHPVVKELYARHGKDLEFSALIISPLSTVLKEKERNAMVTVNLAQQAGADALIISQEGGGNPEADLMMICERAEERGIKTVIMLHDNPGPDGTAVPMVNTSPKADAIITTGNDNAYIVVERMKKNIGKLEALTLLSGTPENYALENGKLKVGVAAIMGSTSNLGFGKQSTTEF